MNKLPLEDMLLDLALYLQLKHKLWIPLEGPFDRSGLVVEWLRSNNLHYDTNSQITAKNIIQGQVNSTVLPVFYRWVYLVLGPKYVPDEFVFSPEDLRELRKTANRAKRIKST